MNKLPKGSHPYPRLGISQGDLQWIEVKRPLPEHRKDMLQGWPPSSLRTANFPTELVLRESQQEPRSNGTLSQPSASFSRPAPLQWPIIAHKRITLAMAVLLTGQKFPTRLFGRSTGKINSAENRAANQRWRARSRATDWPRQDQSNSPSANTCAVTNFHSTAHLDGWRGTLTSGCIS